MPILLDATLGTLLLAEPPTLHREDSSGPAAASQTSAPTVADPVEVEFKNLLARDDAAQGEAMALIQEKDRSNESLLAPFRVTLRARLDRKFDPIRDAYVEFLLRHPDHARAHLAYGSFLNDLGEEAEAVEHYEKARDLDPKNPAAWNNLGGMYARMHQVPKAFACYEEAIRLNPKEAGYPHSLGTLICLFRPEAAAYYRCEEGEVLNRAVRWYEEAVRLDPTNFEFAQDLAQTFYGIVSPQSADRIERDRLGRRALQAWTNALNLATADLQSQGVQIHLARWHLRLGERATARACLERVTDPAFSAIKDPLLASIPLDATPTSPPSLRVDSDNTPPAVPFGKP